MRKSLIFLSFIILCFGCKKEQIVEISDTIQAMPASFSPDGMTQDEYRNIVENSDHIDYVFYDMPLSINQDGRGHVVTDMSHLSTTPAAGIPVGCKPLARKIFFGKGEIIIEADLYFAESCYLQIFLKDQKPVYGNLLTTEGARFYGNLLIQIEEEKAIEADKQMTQEGFLPLDSIVPGDSK